MERPYFYKTQVEKVKAIMSFMTNEPERHFTMEELSEKFDISTSALKQCFKGVYGTAIILICEITAWTWPLHF